MEQVEKWYKMSCHHKINVYYDYNDIIKQLCKIILGKTDTGKEENEIN